MQGQKLDYSGVEEALGKVIQAGDATETNLKAIDKLIEESVGDLPDGYDSVTILSMNPMN